MSPLTQWKLYQILRVYFGRFFFVMAPDEKMNKTDEELLDYISRLPESVIHHIQSFLPFEDIVRSSVLSKMWNRVWSNYPNVDLNLRPAMHRYPHPQFMSITERVMDHCLFRKDCIRKLQLIIPYLVLEELAPSMDRWLEAAIERNASELVVKIHCRRELMCSLNCFYSIPEEIVTGSLKVLEIERCMFEDRFDCIEFPHLQKFTLSHCKFSGDNLLNKILCGCPVLEYLDLSFCKGVGHFLSVSCKPRLKNLKVLYVKELKRIEIFAPSLETFEYFSENPCALDLAGCTALKHLQIVGAVLSTDYVPIRYLLSKLLYIEELQLRNCRVVDKIEISSSCLKKLVMSDYMNFPGAEIDTPNLLHLEFMPKGVCNSREQFSCWNVPKVEEINMSFSVKSFRSVCRAGLKGFLMKRNNYENLKLVIACRGFQDFIMFEKLHAVSFSSLNKFFKKEMPEAIHISSRRDETLLPGMLIPQISPISLSLIYSSRQSIELLYKKLSNDAMITSVLNDLRLVSTEEIEQEMGSVWKSFMEAHSTSYQTATIILHTQS